MNYVIVDSKGTVFVVVDATVQGAEKRVVHFLNELLYSRQSDLHIEEASS